MSLLLLFGNKIPKIRIYPDAQDILFQVIDPKVQIVIYTDSVNFSILPMGISYLSNGYTANQNSVDLFFNICQHGAILNYVAPGAINIEFKFSSVNLWRSLVSKSEHVSLLRLDTISLIELIKQTLAEDRVENINVIYGYPEDNMSVPTVSVEHRISEDEFIELNEEYKNMIRNYDVNVYSRTKGERDQIVASLVNLLDRKYITQDKRINYIRNIEYYLENPIGSRHVSSHKKYYYLNFWPDSTYGVIQHNTSLDLDSRNGFTIDLDLFVVNDRGLITIPIVDRYDNSTNIGYKIYINSSKDLVFDVGFGAVTASTNIGFTNYFNKRILLTVRNIIIGSISTIDIFINGNLLRHSTNFIITPQYFSDYVTLVGALNAGNKTNIVPSLQANMRLYNMKISNSFLDPAIPNGELLTRRDSTDVLQLDLLEGLLRTAYNTKNNSYDIYSDMSINNGCDWVNYYTAMIKKGILYRHGYIDIELESTRDEIPQEYWSYSNV